MRKLRKSRTGFQPVSPASETGKMPVLRYARAAVVVPNGTLFGDGVCARIKVELLKERARLARARSRVAGQRLQP